MFEGPITDALDAYGWAKDALPGLLQRDAGVRVDGSKIVVLGHSAGDTMVCADSELPLHRLAHPARLEPHWTFSG